MSVEPLAKSLPVIPDGIIPAKDLPEDERQAEAWYLVNVTGQSQTSVAKQLGTTQPTISRWLKAHSKTLSTRAEDTEEQREKLISIIEKATYRAFERHEETSAVNQTGPAYLKLVMEGAEKIARLRGIDTSVSSGGGRGGPIEVVVSIGGSEGPVKMGVRG